MHVTTWLGPTRIISRWLDPETGSAKHHLADVKSLALRIAGDPSSRSPQIMHGGRYRSRVEALCTPRTLSPQLNDKMSKVHQHICNGGSGYCEVCEVYAVEDCGAPNRCL